MPCTLILTRHAKSSWDDPLQDDHDRPLNDRGHRATSALGQWLSANVPPPGEALISDARRAVETWEGIAASAEFDCPVRFEPRLYLARPETMLKSVKSARASVVILIAHNPGIAEFAARLVSRPADHPRFHDYPTGATTIVSFQTEDWASIDWHSGQVIDFVVPRDLED